MALRVPARTKPVWGPYTNTWHGVSRLGELLPEIPDHVYGPDARPIEPIRRIDNVSS
jgi:hypothetical protein